MQRAQINIYNERKQFRYGVEYVDNIENISSSNFRYIEVQDPECDCFQFLSPYYSSLERSTNKWTNLPKVDEETQEGSNDHLPTDTLNLSSFNVYFPNYSVETYTGNWLYAFSACTYINGDKIILCETIIDRRNSLAYPGLKVINGIRYSEYVNILVPDPWSITYEDDWSDFRQNVCGEPANINNTGSIITIEIHPIKIVEDGSYVKLDNYLGGLNSLMLKHEDNLSLSTTISYESPRTVKLKFTYPSIYKTLEKYIAETYQIESGLSEITFDSSLVLFDNENIYNVYLATGTDNISFDLTPVEGASTIDFSLSGDGWDSFRPGLQLKAMTDLKCDGLPLITLISNVLYVTQDMFASILENKQSYDIEDVMSKFKDDPNTTSSFNGMDIINIVNKTEKQVINIEKPNDFQNNITRPVFIRAQKNNEITIHPSVTENISINLREYKNYVNIFTLRISDVDFIELGRQSSNIIFKVVGKNLPEALEDGIYYILDDNAEMVTSGQFHVE